MKIKRETTLPALRKENKRLKEELKKKTEMLGAISQVSKTVISGKYLEEILNLIVSMTTQMMNSKICSIMLLDEEKDELRIAATQSLSKAYRDKPPVKVGQSISGRVVKEKRPITVLNVTKEKNYMYPEIAKKEGLVSMLSVPMLFKEQIIGVVNLYTSTEHNFTNEEIQILQTIANQAAIAIENTKLLEESVRTKEALETRKQVERAKGILMEQLKIGESEAYRLIQKKSMDMGKPMKEIAEAVILTQELNPSRPS